jgi:hypothetical protein
MGCGQVRRPPALRPSPLLISLVSQSSQDVKGGSAEPVEVADTGPRQLKKIYQLGEVVRYSKSCELDNFLIYSP